MNLEEIYEANLDHRELHGYIALYQVLIESQEDKWDIWDSFAQDLPARERVAIQKKFEIYAKSDIYTTLSRVAIDQSNRIIKQAKSFAIDYCRRNEAFLYDRVD